MSESASVYVAKQAAHVLYDGNRVRLAKGERVAADHQLVKDYPQLFEAADEGLRFGVEDATARPGAKRGGKRAPRKDTGD